MTQNERLRLQDRAAQGDADCQYQLAMMYIYGNGVPEDNVLAFELLQKSAAQNHTEAAYNLAICYHYGYGTDVNLKAAYQLYLQAANAGYGKGMELIGRFYNRGIYVPCDREQAEFWLRKAVESDDAAAVEEAAKELEFGIN